MRALTVGTAAVVLALLLACAGSAEPKRGRVRPAAPQTVAFQTLVQRGIPGQAGEQIREVARDAASWHDLWARLRQGTSLLPEEPPAVDFTRQMAIVAAMPTQSCVSKVTIRSVQQIRGEVVVNLLEEPPAPNCVCIVSQRPLHAVRLPQLASPVRFVVEQGQTSCGRLGR